jgi:solute carrier family 25 (mitochondrial carnitine/acylcarnitine transporter), member 20/29
MESFWAGLISGIFQTAAGHPLDTLKVWKQNNSQLKPSFFNLYKGIKYPLIQNPLLCSSGFYTNDLLLKYTSNIYLSSGVAGFVNSIILAPLDYYKIRKQEQLSTNLLHSYKNYSVVASREIPANFIYFSTYDSLREKKYSIELAGGIAGVSSWGLTYPFDTLKTRMQTNVHLSLINALKQGNLFQGFSYCIVRAFIVNALGFKVYETTKEYLGKLEK